MFILPLVFKSFNTVLSTVLGTIILVLSLKLTQSDLILVILILFFNRVILNFYNNRLILSKGLTHFTFVLIKDLSYFSLLLILILGFKTLVLPELIAYFGLLVSLNDFIVLIGLLGPDGGGSGGNSGSGNRNQKPPHGNDSNTNFNDGEKRRRVKANSCPRYFHYLIETKVNIPLFRSVKDTFILSSQSLSSSEGTLASFSDDDVFESSDSEDNKVVPKGKRDSDS